MDFKELAKRIGIESCPDKFEVIYNKTDIESTECCDIRALEKFESEYGVFKDFFPAVLEGARDLARKPDLLAWCNTACAFLSGDISLAEARTTPVPAVDDSPAGDTVMIFPLLACVPRCVVLFEKRGFSREEISATVGEIYTDMNLVRLLTGRPGMNRVYFHWLMRYLFCEMFDYGSLNFELTKFPYPAVLLRNKKSGEHAVIMTEGRFHQSGQLLGNPGYEDGHGAFDAEFSETDTAFIGHASSPKGFLSKELPVFRKDEWEAVVRQGGGIISLHIPRFSDLSAEALERTYRGGIEIIKQRFADHNIKYLYCSSWIIDSRLRGIIGDSSKIVGFGDTFLRFPTKCTGRDGKSFIFFGSSCPDEELPEGTSLQRKVKELYLNGGYTYNSAGFITEVHL